MQFFPTATDIANTANDLVNTFSTYENAFSNGESFDGVLNSYIEEEREKYTGRPAGFAAFGPESGTLGHETSGRIAEELRKRKVSELSIGKLEELAASGAPVTVSSAFSALSGEGRYTEELEGAGRDRFKSLMNKFGFTKTEQEEMLELSDAGKTKELLARISEKFKELGATDVDKKEFASLLKGLDVSSNTTKSILSAFDGKNDLTLSGADIEQLLSTVKGEQAERENAALFAKTQMRAAVDAALNAAKAGEKSATIDDARGNRVSDQKEAFMQDSVFKNTGMNKLSDGMASDTSGSENGHDLGHDFHDAQSGKNRSQRILETNADTKVERGFESKIQKETKTDTTLKRVIPHTDSQPNIPQADTSAQNLNNTSKSVRQEIFSQVEQGILRGAQNGAQRLTLQLTPNDLGQVTVIISVHQGELKASIRADQPDSVIALQEQMAELKASLEAEGFKVAELDVQSNVREDPTGGQWNSPSEHNHMREAEERNRMLRLANLRREAAAQARQDGQTESGARVNAEKGLHVVA